MKSSTNGTTFYLFAESFREACAGQDPGLIARALAIRGMLEPGNDGKPHKLVRLPQLNGPRRCYVLTGGLFLEAPQSETESS